MNHTSTQHSVRGLRAFCVVMLAMCAMVFQPMAALAMTTGPGSDWVELDVQDTCGATCCCVPQDGTQARRSCPCNVTPTLPAEAPLPFFAPTSRPVADDGVNMAFAKRAPLFEGQVNPSAQGIDAMAAGLEGKRAGPLIRLLPRGLRGLLAFLQTARI